MFLKSHKKIFSFYVRLHNKMFAVNLIRTTKTVSLQRDNYNIKMCLNLSETSIISRQLILSLL